MELNFLNNPISGENRLGSQSSRNGNEKGLVSFFKGIFGGDNGEDEPPSHPGELDFIDNIKEFFQTTIREVMVPRTKMTTIESKQTIQDAIKLVNETGFSRIPVQDNRKDNIVGILNAKDLFSHFHSPELQVVEVMRKPYFTSYSQPIHHLFSTFKHQRNHMAIVIDEYGGVDGLVTLEDLIEELVGDILDEHDEATPSFQTINDHEIVIKADYLLDDFNKLYETSFEKEGVETIGGYICHYLGKIPEEGENFNMDNLHIIIEQCDQRRIEKLRVTTSP
ncbi:MAG: putative hemolysin [bacterium]|jgi:putative hemolysin